MNTLNDPDGLVNLHNFTNQLAKGSLRSDKAIPIVLGKLRVPEVNIFLLTIISSSGVFWMGHTIIWCHKLLGWYGVHAKSAHRRRVYRDCYSNRTAFDQLGTGLRAI